MTQKDLQSLENEPFSIGNIIREEMMRQGRSVAWLARVINCDRRNIYDIFSRHSIDTGLLWRLSQALQCDFFAALSNAMNRPGPIDS